MKTMKGYQDFYLKCGVLLLADGLEKIRNNSFDSYGLCPSHYLSTPSSSWDANLKITKIELELISDSDICSLRNVQEAKFLIFLIDIAKPTINI